MAKGTRTLDRVSVGSSGWSYPTWRPGFYPAGLDPAEFLRFYAERFRTVELNTTGYRHEDEPTAPAYAQRLIELVELQTR